MAKVKNISGADLIVPSLGGLVLKGQVVEVSEEALPGLICQDTNWQAVDKSAKRSSNDTPEGD